MFTSQTLSAISILHAISIAELGKPDLFTSPDTCALLDRLASGGFIRLMSGHPCGYLTSYSLVRPLQGISLLNLLDALGESLNNVHYIDSNFYEHYGLAARKLGVITQITRTCLSEINVSEIPIPQEQPLQQPQ